MDFKMKKPFFPILINNLIKLEKRMTSLLSNIITLHVVIKSICNCITLMVLRFSEKDMNMSFYMPVLILALHFESKQKIYTPK